jgi:amidase
VLDGLRFTVKDNIDVAGERSSFGNPTWARSHPPARHHAICVELLLAAGATCVGKAVADELTYSLEGENPFYGTPLNPKAPERIPGGSSSGSASSVACGLAELSLGTDSGGSVRVPASFCGVWGMRPSLHRISEAGVLPFMPSVSTVGLLAQTVELLHRGMRVLLSSPRASATVSSPGARPKLDGEEACAPASSSLLLLEDAFALAEPEIAAAAEHTLQRIASAHGLQLERVRFEALAGRSLPLSACNLMALREVQSAEFQTIYDAWIDEHRDALGPVLTKAYRNVEGFERRKLVEAFLWRERFWGALHRFMGPGRLLCFPTTPCIAPLMGSLDTLPAISDFYHRSMALSALAGVAGLPEISAPLLSVDGCPAGVSFVGGYRQDEWLLEVVEALTAAVAGEA